MYMKEKIHDIIVLTRKIKKVNSDMKTQTLHRCET